MEVQRISWPVHPTVFHLQWSGGIGRLILSWAKTTLIVVCVLLISFLLHFVLAEWRTVWPADWLLAECMELPWSIIHVSLQHKSGIHFILIALFDGLKRCCFLERHFYEPKFGQHAELKRERYFRGKTASTCLLKLLVNVLSLKESCIWNHVSLFRNMVNDNFSIVNSILFNFQVLFIPHLDHMLQSTKFSLL